MKAFNKKDWIVSVEDGELDQESTFKLSSVYQFVYKTEHGKNIISIIQKKKLL